MEAPAVAANSTTSYQAARVIDAFSLPGKITKVNGSMHRISR